MIDSRTDPQAAALPPERAQAIARGEEPDLFAWLGPHPLPTGQAVVRAFVPGAKGVTLLERASCTPLGALQAAGEEGLFAIVLPAPVDYLLRIHWPGGDQDSEDPYRLPPMLYAGVLARFHQGDPQAALALGARLLRHGGVEGVRFAVWAPHARRVSVVGDFNGWDGRRHVLRRHPGGVWEIFVPQLAAGALYKFELLTADGRRLLKADPFARRAELPPGTASIVAASELAHQWHDAAWCAQRSAQPPWAAPISIYEVHAGAWRHLPGEPGTAMHWQALTETLVPYVQEMGFTHIELMPLAEYPFGGSWGYQPVALFALTQRYGSEEAFAAFVEACHAAGIGVLLDWVPGHFPGDAHGLHEFDGQPLFEYAHPFEGRHAEWDTWVYDYRRPEVRAFLIASALHWLRRFHLDGLRVDAVASMLYRDYGRAAGQWLPNHRGGVENLEAVSFLRRLNTAVHAQCPGALVIAEESTAWPGVTHSLAEGGLGFDFKWNMGWMHDTLRYMGRDSVHRSYHGTDITFGLSYAFSERFVLSVSHDEVVHGKGSLPQRMAGDPWQRFANLRLFLALMWTHPGKKLLFMGCEWGQWREWHHDRELDWALLEAPEHAGVQALVARLNRLYRSHPALHQGDAEAAGFQWLVADDRRNSVFAWLRWSHDHAPVLVVHNTTPAPMENYHVGVPLPGAWAVLLNTDQVEFGGSGYTVPATVMAEGRGCHGQPCSLSLRLPPLATLVLAPVTAADRGSLPAQPSGFAPRRST